MHSAAQKIHTPRKICRSGTALSSEFNTNRFMAFEAARVATRAADPHWEIKVLLRASDVLDRCGDHDDAITMQTRAMTLMVRHPDVSDAMIDSDRAHDGRMM